MIAMGFAPMQSLLQLRIIFMTLKEFKKELISGKISSKRILISRRQSNC